MGMLVFGNLILILSDCRTPASLPLPRQLLLRRLVVLQLLQRRRKRNPMENLTVREWASACSTTKKLISGYPFYRRQMMSELFYVC
jgi:hypothetical protein